MGVRTPAVPESPRSRSRCVASLDPTRAQPDSVGSVMARRAPLLVYPSGSVTGGIVGVDATNDSAIIAALRRGDDQAYASLVRDYHRAMLSVAMLYVSDAAVAEEVIQEAWVGVLRGIDKFEARSTLRTWIFRILINQAKTKGQREHRSVPVSTLVAEELTAAERAVPESRFRSRSDTRWPGHWSDPPVQAGSEVEEILVNREALEVVSRTMRALPRAQSLVMSLRDVDGWTSREVCDALEISAENQRVLLHRARSRVRSELERYWKGEVDFSGRETGSGPQHDVDPNRRKTKR